MFTRICNTTGTQAVWENADGVLYCGVCGEWELASDMEPMTDVIASMQPAPAHRLTVEEWVRELRGHIVYTA